MSDILQHARNLTEEDLSTFCEDLITAINSSPLADCHSSFKQLFIVMHSSCKQHRLSPQLLEALVKVLLVPDRSRLVAKVTAGLLLTELSPSMHLNLPVVDLLHDDTQIPFILPVIFAQGYDKNLLSSIAPQVIRWLSTVGFNAEVQTSALSAAVTLVHLYPEMLSKDNQHVVDCQLAEWLRTASLHQATRPGARRLFKRDEQLAVTELDGHPTRSLFTALCLGQYYTDDQLLNIHSFAVTQSWFLHTRGVCPYGPPDPQATPTPPTSPHRSRSVELGHGDGRRSRDSSPTHSVAAYPLEDASLQYVLRVLEQWDRKPKAALDVEVQEACVLEAVGVLNQLCLCDISITPRATEEMKRLYRKLSPHCHQRLLVAVMQFYLNHSEAVMLDSLPVFEQFFGSVLGVSYANPCIAFDTIMFVQDNREMLICKTTLLTTYFPNLLKILAWDPQAYVLEFAELLPAFLSPTTAIEVFHALLDLPLLSAALEVTKRAEVVNSDPQPWQPISAQLVEKLREPQYKPLFKFILRTQGGKGDTIDRLDTLHKLLSNMSSHPRVVTCADTIPVMLRVYFEVVLSEGGPDLASTLVPVVLERARLLYAVAGYQRAVHSVLAEQVVALFGRYPRLVADQIADISDFISNIRHVTQDENLFIHVVWVVGEYLTSWYDARVTPDRVVAMFDVLETVAYEAVGRGRSVPAAPPVGKPDNYSPRLLTAIMSALAKLASRSQDLIPRVMLCLTKLGQAGPGPDVAGGHAVTARAAELLSLLQVPNIAAMVLNPHPERESGRWHTENTSLPAVLRATSRLLHSPTK